MTRERRKALLRSLIDKVVLRRAAPDRISVRIVWRGGEVSDLVVEQAVNGLQAVSAWRRDGGPAARPGAPGC